ncbi:MAG: hypothetical protein HPM95_20235, partial [Alphaproteobacteria bacterium]|nr:hypothetical protein [Alphaproteobacteria bacterium]
VDATGFTDEGKLKFLLRVEPDVDIRAFREEDAYVVDVTPRDMPTDPVNAAIDAALQVQDDMPDGVREVVTAPGAIQAVPNPAPAVAASAVEAPSAAPPAPVPPAAAAARGDAAPASLAEEAVPVAGSAGGGRELPAAAAAAPVAPIPVAKPTAGTDGPGGAGIRATGRRRAAAG